MVLEAVFINQLMEELHFRLYWVVVAVQQILKSVQTESSLPALEYLVPVVFINPPIKGIHGLTLDGMGSRLLVSKE